MIKIIILFYDNSIMKNNDEVLWDYHQKENRIHLTNGYPRQDMIFKAIRKCLGKGGTILEIGFGDGYLLNKLQLSGYDTIGQDISEINIEETKKQRNNYKTEFIIGDLSGKLKAQKDSLDGFVASEVLEHMDNKELDICIDDIYRCLKKGGYVFITFPCREVLKDAYAICPECGKVFHIWGHKQSWDEKKIKSKFSKFEIIKIKEYFGRCPGRNRVEKILLTIMSYARTFVNKYLFDLGGKSYFIILKKK